MNSSVMNEIIEVTTHRDGWSATDNKSDKKYKVESIMLGVGDKRRPVAYEKYFLSVGSQFWAEILSNGKLKIL